MICEIYMEIVIIVTAVEDMLYVICCWLYRCVRPGYGYTDHCQ